MQKKVDWIFFDLDGTLINSVSVLFEVYLNFLKRYGVNGTKQEFDQLNGASLTDIALRFKTNYSINKDVETLCEEYKAYINDSCKRGAVSSYEDARSALARLSEAGYKLILVTSAPREYVEDIFRRENWVGYFSHYVCGNDATRPKPFSDIYFSALKKAVVAPERAMAVEDSPNGIQSARGAGLKVLGLARGHSHEELKQAGAHYTAVNLDRILDLLEDESSL